MTREDMLALADRVESLTGPCAGDDADIELAIGNWSPEHHEAWNRYQECGECANPPLTSPSPPRPFTASLDAAMSLKPDGREFSIEGGWDYSGCHPAHVRATAWVSGAPRVYAATPALALTAASLRARAEQLP
jgi:hypothetical protein